MTTAVQEPDDVVVEIVGLRKRFGGAEVLSGVDLKVRRGETVAIIGPSGSGKTTLLRCVNFLSQYDAGSVYVGGQLVGYRDDGGIRRPARASVTDSIRSRIGMVFQKYALFPHRTALENLMEGPRFVLGLPKAEAEKRGLEALAAVGLANRGNSYPSELSGGQQQRVGIARALAMHPQLMLFDEVTSALDPELVAEVLAVMRRLAEQKMTMLVVTHEMQFARDVADRVVFMEGGKILSDMAAREFFAAPPSSRIESFLRSGLGRYPADAASSG